MKTNKFPLQSERSGEASDEDDLPLRKGKNAHRRNQLLSKKKSKKSNSNDDDGPSKAKKKLSMLFGRRRYTSWGCRKAKKVSQRLAKNEKVGQRWTTFPFFNTFLALAETLSTVYTVIMNLARQSSAHILF